METWQVVLLGLLEGLTEFIPVSSTGHILLAGYFLGFDSPGKVFEVLIQLGAILAILSVYSAKLWRIAVSLPTDPRARRFVMAVLLAFLPESPLLICSTLIIGGIILLIVDRLPLKPKYHDAMDFPPLMALAIGVCQCFAMIPGVSRSGATIVGALLLGTDKRSAAEFSFFLAMPTMSGAFAYDLYKNWSILSPDDTQAIALGFVVSFFAAVVVVRYLLDFVASHGFAFFAWWRILVGVAGIAGLYVMTPAALGL
jgi:undecaprenyl-diphosphatase